MTYNEPRMPAWQRALSDRIAADIVVAWALAAATYLVVAIDAPSVIRFGVALPSLFVLPGYVLVAILFPSCGPVTATDRLSSVRSFDRVTARERLALAFGLSLALLPVIGILIGVSPWGFSGIVVARAFVAFVLVGGLLAAIVRRRLSPADRFRIPLDHWAGETRRALWSGPPLDRALNLLVIGSIVVALLVVGGALAVPSGGQTYTDFAVLSEDDDGELVAGGYPDDLSPDESATLVTAVENHERQSTNYTVVIAIERIDGPAGENRTVEHERFSASVAPGERWTRRHELAPTRSGSQLRAHYYLYRGDAPEEPDAASAYRHLYVGFSGDGDA